MGRVEGGIRVSPGEACFHEKGQADEAEELLYL